MARGQKPGTEAGKSTDQAPESKAAQSKAQRLAALKERAKSSATKDQAPEPTAKTQDRPKAPRSRAPKEDPPKAEAPPTEAPEGDDVWDRSVARRLIQVEEDTQAIAGEIYSESFMMYLEATGGGIIDPLSDDALKIQAQYIGKGIHPLDTLKRLSSNPFVKPSERISAAKVLLEYSARKIPAQLELSTPEGQPLRLTGGMLANLTDKELDTLEKLLLKAQGAKEKT